MFVRWRGRVGEREGGGDQIRELIEVARLRQSMDMKQQSSICVKNNGLLD